MHLRRKKRDKRRIFPVSGAKKWEEEEKSGAANFHFLLSWENGSSGSLQYLGGEGEGVFPCIIRRDILEDFSFSFVPRKVLLR